LLNLISSKLTVATKPTDNSIDDASAAKEMLKDAQNCLASLTGDGAYDKFFPRIFRQ
jgi:hypothetical protein